MGEGRTRRGVAGTGAWRPVAQWSLTALLDILSHLIGQRHGMAATAGIVGLVLIVFSIYTLVRH